MPIMGSWSAMRKYLENEMLCNSLKGRVRYNLTTYSNMDRCGHFEIFVDGKSRKIFSMDYAASQLHKSSDKSEDFWKNYWAEKENASVHQQFDDTDFAKALKEYRSSDIQTSIKSENPIVRMFAVLDRRTGKRTLSELKNNLSEQPEWLRFFYELRLSSENLLQ